jgi:septum formation protein
MRSPTPLVLASSSRHRRALLGRLGLEFACDSPGIDERPLADEPPEHLAARLARDKARTVARRHPDALVIGSDQVASLGSRVLGKPGTEARARAQLAECSGRELQFFTAVCLHRPDGHEDVHCDLTRVRFRALDDAEIARYVSREQPLDSAGAFRCEDLGIVLFEAIESRDPTALIGLPLIWLSGALRRAGLPLP